MKVWLAAFIAFLPLMTLSQMASADFIPPTLTGPVVDEANVLRPQTAHALERALRALKEQGGSQINVLTVKSLEGVSIEQAGIKTLDKWKLGGEKTDNGAILLVAPTERRVRIEVGQGLEGTLTDAESKRIIAESITPLFKQNDFDSGIMVGVFKIVEKTDPDFNFKSYLEARGPRTHERGPQIPRFWIFIGMIILFFLLSRGGGGGFGSGLLLGSLLGGGRGGFGGGGGGSDWGGGWGGGGGSGSGGGASGDW